MVLVLPRQALALHCLVAGLLGLGIVKLDKGGVVSGLILNGLSDHLIELIWSHVRGVHVAQGFHDS